MPTTPSQGPDRVPSSPSPAARGDLGERLAAELARDAKIEEELANPRGSRVARGCSAVIALAGMLVFGGVLALGVTILLKGRMGAGLGVIGVALPFLLGLGWLSGRWLRGLAPTRRQVSEAQLRERRKQLPVVSNDDGG